MKIVVVIPVMNERPTLEKLVQDIVEHIAPHQYHLFFVDDGSTDGSWEELQRLSRAYPHVEAIRFARNLGKTAALDAAFCEVDGDLILTMDADLQDDPKEIPRLVEKLEEGFDMVCGWKATRNDPWHKTLPSRLYNCVIAHVFGTPIHDTNTGYKLMRAPVAKGLTLFADMHRMIAVEAHLQGNRIAEIVVTHHPRRFGKSKYGLERIYRGLRDAYTTWLRYRCPVGPARYFRRWAICLFFVAIALGGGVLAGRPESSFLLALATCLVALLVLAGIATTAMGYFGAHLIARMPEAKLEYPIVGRAGGA